MPKINLISHDSKKKTTVSPLKPTPHDFKRSLKKTFILSLPGVVVILITWGYLVSQIAQREAKLRTFAGVSEIFENNKNQMDELKIKLTSLKGKIAIMEDISSRQIFWYEKFARLADMIPEGIWLSEVSLRQEKSSAKELTQDDLRGGFGGKTVLLIKGVAVAPKIQDAIALIGEYIKRLQDHKDFISEFEDIKLNTATKSTMGSLDVMRFDFICEPRER